ncbi:hypothetical protein, partial [Thiolapillus sp.]|uniref:hypothetical protein n=1 Tax=Thiolapillus sp. TaxID=2017437 RepID=UPI003AF615EF
MSRLPRIFIASIAIVSLRLKIVKVLFDCIYATTKQPKKRLPFCFSFLVAVAGIHPALTLG